MSRSGSHLRRRGRYLDRLSFHFVHTLLYRYHALTGTPLAKFLSVVPNKPDATQWRFWLCRFSHSRYQITFWIRENGQIFLDSMCEDNWDGSSWNTIFLIRNYTQTNHPDMKRTHFPITPLFYREFSVEQMARCSTTYMFIASLSNVYV